MGRSSSASLKSFTQLYSIWRAPAPSQRSFFGFAYLVFAALSGCLARDISDSVPRYQSPRAAHPDLQ